jgi:hypothetical protein
MIRVLLHRLIGGDPQRDKETFFLTLALEFGTPRPLEDLHLRYPSGKAKISRSVEPDVDFVMRFAQLAHAAGYTCDAQKNFVQLYSEYLDWYRRNHPELSTGGDLPDAGAGVRPAS